MVKNKFVILCLRLLGIYFFVLGLASLPGIITVSSHNVNREFYFMVGPIIYLISGSILFTFAPRTSRFIVKFSEAEEEDFRITDYEKTARIAFLVLGIFIFAQALPHLIQLSIDVRLYYSRIDEIPKHLRNQQQRWTILIGPALKLVISIILIIGPDRIIGLISKYDHSFKKIK
ncbi:MAG: hypothetical protein PVH74_18290 [Desulfobacterales bacterium]